MPRWAAHDASVMAPPGWHARGPPAQGLGQQQHDPQAGRAPARHRILQPQLAGMQMRHRLHQRQAEAGARRGAGLVGAEEALAGMAAVLGREPGPVVGDRRSRSPWPTRRAARAAPCRRRGVNLMALSSRLATACSSRSRSPTSSSRVGQVGRQRWPRASARDLVDLGRVGQHRLRSSGAKAARRAPASASAMRSRAWKMRLMASRSAMPCSTVGPQRRLVRRLGAARPPAWRGPGRSGCGGRGRWRRRRRARPPSACRCAPAWCSASAPAGRTRRPGPRAATREPRSPPAMAAVVAKTGRIRACSACRSSQAPSRAKRTTAPEAQNTPSVSSRRSCSRSDSSRPTSSRRPGSSSRCSRASAARPSCSTRVRNQAPSSAGAGRPAVEVAGQPAAALGVDQQVDRLVLDVDGEALLDRLGQAGGAGLAPALGQGDGIGAHRGVGLPVQRARGRPPQHRDQGDGGRGEHGGEEQREAEAGAVQQPRRAERQAAAPWRHAARPADLRLRAAPQARLQGSARIM